RGDVAAAALDHGCHRVGGGAAGGVAGCHDPRRVEHLGQIGVGQAPPPTGFGEGGLVEHRPGDLAAGYAAAAGFAHRLADDDVRAAVVDAAGRGDELAQVRRLAVARVHGRPHGLDVDAEGSHDTRHQPGDAHGEVEGAGHLT